MNKNSTQQEILLLTGTNFSSRYYCEKDDNGNENLLNEREQLEEACWNGLIKNMLPEICEFPNDTTKIYLWQIRETRSFIQLELGETPEEMEKSFSINPYAFLSNKRLS